MTIIVQDLNVGEEKEVMCMIGNVFTKSPVSNIGMCHTVE